MTTAYPPIHHHSTKRVSTSIALSLLSAYLDAAATDPSLHPNALLTENGPITPSSGASSGLVLHNLKRVEAGMKGEHLGADLTLEEYGGEGLPDTIGGHTIAGANETPVGGLQNEGQDLEGGWQDKEEFEREQDIEQGEIGKRDNAVEGNQMPKVKVAKGAGHEVDKDARKRRKKERRKKEREALLASKQREKDAED